MGLTIHVDIVSAEESLFSGAVDYIIAPAEMGEVGIYPRHAPLITRLKPGTVHLKLADRNEEEILFVSGGILEVQPSLVTILADTALRGRDIDEAKAHEAQKKAEEAMRDRSAAIDYAKAQSEMAVAVAQLRALYRFKQRHGKGRGSAPESGG
jgi:F-type H+-transporting ATPase subunit epsilon